MVTMMQRPPAPDPTMTSHLGCQGVTVIWWSELLHCPVLTLAIQSGAPALAGGVVTLINTQFSSLSDGLCFRRLWYGQSHRSIRKGHFHRIQRLWHQNWHWHIGNITREGSIQRHIHSLVFGWRGQGVCQALQTPGWCLLHGLAVHWQRMSMLGLSCSWRPILLLAGAAEQDLSAGHLAVSPQLAGPLLPHWHGHPFSSLSPGHERVRGVEWWGWAALPDAPLGFFQGAGVGRPASVDGSFPVQVRPPPPASPEKRKKRQNVSMYRETFLYTECHI